MELVNRITKINQLHNDIKNNLVIGLEKAIEIGNELLEQKKECGYGNFIEWIENNLEFDVRQSQKYIQIFNKQNLITNTNCGSYLGVNTYIQEIRQIEKDNKQSQRNDKLSLLSQDTDKKLPVNIKLLEGDIFEKINEIDNNSIDLVITDPPYFMNKAEWDIFKNKDEFINFTQKWINNILLKLKKDYQIFICFNSEYFIDLEMICRKLKLPIQSRLIWHYRNAGGKSQGKYMLSKTYDVILHIGNKELNFDDKWTDERFDVWTIAIPQSNFNDGKYHLTQKPLELFRRLIKLGSKENDLILDCFAGSGTAGIVCQELNRNCILIEKEKEYCNIIRNRINGI